MTYEELLIEADSNGLTVKEKNLQSADGRIKGTNIAIRRDICTNQKACALAEELGHHYTSVGNIVDMNSVNSRKQEYRARLWAYDKHIGLIGIVKAYEHHCANLYEMAEHLEVTEDFLKDALACYRGKYGLCATIDNYTITFEPSLCVIKRLD